MQEDWVLCRVFYKSKTENTELNPQIVYDAEAKAVGDTSPDAAKITLPGCNNKYHHQIVSSESLAPHPQNPNNLQPFSPLNPNILLLSHQYHSDHLSDIIMINSKCEKDDYRFLLDPNFEDISLGDGMASNMEVMEFEDDHSSLIFLQ